jgi:predicted 2-oxoglutarate/Fe(II)-dependent dioxygenase YbiX
MNLRDSVLIRGNAIGRVDLDFLTNYLRRAEMTDSLVSNFEDEPASGDVEWVVNKKVRDTQEVRLSETAVAKVSAIVDASVGAFIDPFYAVKVRDWESPHILHYGRGGHYTAHVDAETLYTDDLDRVFWEKTLDRDLSVVYFVNDDFAGGELVFPDIDLVVKPQAGTLVCFPSDHNYIHGVNPVTSGHRYTIVTWMRVEGMPPPEEVNRASFDEFNRARPKQFMQPPRLRKGGA